MEVPVDIFIPATEFLAFGELGLVYSTENARKLYFEGHDGSSAEFEINVGVLLKVAVGSTRIAVLGTNAVALYDKTCAWIRTIQNEANLVDVVVAEEAKAASRADGQVITWTLGPDGFVKESSAPIEGKNYLALDCGTFKSTEHAIMGDWRIGSHYVALGSTVYDTTDRILCAAVSSNPPMIAVGLESKELKVFVEGECFTFDLRYTPIALVIYAPDLDGCVYYLHESGISQVDFEGDFEDVLIASVEDIGEFGGNISGFVVTPAEPSKYAADSMVQPCGTFENSGPSAEVAYLREKIASLEEEVEVLTKALNKVNLPPATIRLAQKISSREGKTDLPESIPEALTCLFTGQGSMYYFLAFRDKLIKYLDDAPAPVTAQLVKLILINEFPSSELADELVRGLGEPLVDADVYDGVMAKYRDYLVYAE